MVKKINYNIIPFQNTYRDDMIFCLLSAKDALGRIPRLNEDLLDIGKNYFDKGEMFWLALDDHDRVIGMLGTNTIPASGMWLKRFYVKPALKRNGLGSALLATLEDYAKSKNISALYTRCALDYIEGMQFYPAKGFVEIEHEDLVGIEYKDGVQPFVKNL